MSKQDVKVQRVTQADYDKVMSISPEGDIYSGTDYLRDYFKMLIDMPSIEAYAVVIDGIFRSFVAMMIVDDGKTVVPRAGRTHKDFTGQRINERLFDWFEKHSPRRQDFVHYTSTGGSHIKGLLGQIERGSKRIILQQEYRSYVNTSSDLSERLAGFCYNLTTAKSIDEEGLGEILSNQALHRELFPEGRLIVDWVPYRPMKSNANLIKTARTSMVVSDLGNSKKCVLTFGNYFMAAIGLVCNLDVYGHADFILKDHILLQIKHILPHAKSKKVIIRCFGPENTNWDFVYSLMKDFGFHEEEIFGTGLLCVEQTINERSKL